MKITIDKVRALDPCKDRFDNFVNNYPGFIGSLKDFLSLDKITYTDKVWVCTRLMTPNQKFYWARACAFSVLDIFENSYPNDKRVRDLLEYLNTIDDVEKLTRIQLDKILRLKKSVNFYPAYSNAVARAACCSAVACSPNYTTSAYTQLIASTAANYAADSADSAYTAYSIADAAYNAYTACRKTQEEINLILLYTIYNK